MNNEERIVSLHRQIKIRRRKREKRNLWILVTAGVLLAGCVALLLIPRSGGRIGMDAGSFVLIAVIVLLIGAEIFTAFKWRQDKRFFGTEKEYYEKEVKKHMSLIPENNLMAAAGGKGRDQEDYKRDKQ